MFKFLKRLVGAPLGTVTRAAYLDGCEFRPNFTNRTVEVFIPGKVILVNRNNNLKKTVEGKWLTVTDVGNMWSEFELSDPADEDYELYIGDSNSYETAMVYSNNFSRVRGSL